MKKQEPCFILYYSLCHISTQIDKKSQKNDTVSGECLLQADQKIIDGLPRRRSAGDETDAGMGGIHRMVRLELITEIPQMLQDAVRQDQKLLIGRRSHSQRALQCGDSVPEQSLKLYP